MTTLRVMAILFIALGCVKLIVALIAKAKEN